MYGWLYREANATFYYVTFQTSLYLLMLSSSETSLDSLIIYMVGYIQKLMPHFIIGHSTCSSLLYIYWCGDSHNLIRRLEWNELLLGYEVHIEHMTSYIWDRHLIQLSHQGHSVQEAHTFRFNKAFCCRKDTTSNINRKPL